MPVSGENIQSLVSLLAETDFLARTMYKILPQYSNAIALFASFTPQEWYHNIKNTPMGLKLAGSQALDKIKSFGSKKRKQENLDEEIDGYENLDEKTPFYDEPVKKDDITKQLRNQNKKNRKKKPNQLNKETEKDSKQNQDLSYRDGEIENEPKENTGSKNLQTKKSPQEVPNQDQPPVEESSYNQKGESIQSYDKEEKKKKKNNTTDTTSKKPDSKEQSKKGIELKQKRQKKRRQEINQRYRSLKREKQKRAKRKDKGGFGLSAVEREFINRAKYIPVVGSIICSVDSASNAVSAASEKSLDIVLKTVKTAKRLTQVAEKAGALAEGTAVWVKTIIGLCATFLGAIIAVIIFILYPFWVGFYILFNMGTIAKALHKVEKKLKKIEKKIKKLMIKVKTDKRIDKEMAELRAELKTLKF